ncbi:hypothetical protein MRB53_008368 [Persea americana]|uniref:Uncharacterized protein n=1 Tax=Persea americana TaxID=3435 RepID=A0ACC2MLW7_PERAE|nr:hypothetical protein MRB53_008368 [Persea americana]|eukprot:TRINITY_DN5341_c1_g1_i1.p1 TRINITY_DN5341_c1_g1~~TRINITY_DN5341_c1_g1_i1.p1  ORF type:complete len:314 (+),score=45.44 TRINITY_DN5341_c1_g1_i1:31-972(+)
MSNPEPSLPPGFRFHPTDEELILHYLRKKAASTPCPVSIIAEVDIYKFNPWDLPAKAAFGEKEWYFFSPRDRKYPNGDRPNRAAGFGYWKATGTDKRIVDSEGKKNIGVKKALVFYKGRPPKGLKTNWIMHEYRLAAAINNNNIISSSRRRSNDRPMRLDDWVLCRIYMKNHSAPTMVTMDRQKHDPLIKNDFAASLPNITNQTTLFQSFSDPLPPIDYPLLTRFLSDNRSESSRSELAPVVTNHSLNSNCCLPLDLPGQESSYAANLLTSKKFNDSCTFTTITNQLDTPQYYSLNHTFYNQHVPLNSHIGFQ